MKWILVLSACTASAESRAQRPEESAVEKYSCELREKFAPGRLIKEKVLELKENNRWEDSQGVVKKSSDRLKGATAVDENCILRAPLPQKLQPPWTAPRSSATSKVTLQGIASKPQRNLNPHLGGHFSASLCLYPSRSIVP